MYLDFPCSGPNIEANCGLTVQRLSPDSVQPLSHCQTPIIDPTKKANFSVRRVYQFPHSFGFFVATGEISALITYAFEQFNRTVGASGVVEMRKTVSIESVMKRTRVAQTSWRHTE